MNSAGAVVVLAAGASRRLGTPKQLLPFRGSTLLAHAVRTAREADLGPVFVVLGSEAARCREALAGLDVSIVEHAEWTKGMGTSIAAGVGAATAADRDALLLMTCDQPGVTATHLRALAEARTREDADAAASSYEGVAGTPATFGSRLFPALRSLPPEAGARLLLSDPRYRIVSVPCPECAFDVDTADAAARLE